MGRRHLLPRVIVMDTSHNCRIAGTSWKLGQSEHGTSTGNAIGVAASLDG